MNFKKHSYKTALAAIVIIIAASVAVTAFVVYRRYLYYLPLEYKHNQCNITTDALKNPYCGFYQIYPYKIDGNQEGNWLPGNIDEITDRLAMIQFNLSLYKDMPLSKEAISQIGNILIAWSGTDKQLILRFLYDWNGKASLTEPSGIDIILKHMEQTASVYNKYARSIFILQGLYIGNYGEMNGSSYQDKEAITCLAKKLNEVSDTQIFFAVRTPAQLRTIKENTKGILNTRLGLFNDGILASQSDLGTYADGMRESEIAFQEKLCLTVPNGGETVTDNPLNNIGNAIKDLKRMHVSYLNSMYDSAVLNKWKASVYTGNGIFNGMDGYNYIERHLGFRYIIKSSALEFKPESDKKAKLSIILENTGFAPNYYPFVYTVTCINKETGKSYIIKPGILQEKDSQIIKLNAMLDVRSIEPGVYNIYFNTSDSKTGEIIKYATDTPLTDKGYLAGTLSYLEK